MIQPHEARSDPMASPEQGTGLQTPSGPFKPDCVHCSTKEQHASWVNSPGIVFVSDEYSPTVSSKEQTELGNHPGTHLGGRKHGFKSHL